MLCELSHLLTKSYQPADNAVQSCSRCSLCSHDEPLIAAVKDTEASGERKDAYNCLEERGVRQREPFYAELTKEKSRHQCSMNAYLTKQHSCSRGSDGMDAGRSAPTLIRDAHCACGWQRNAQGLGYSSQTMPSSGPGGAASNRTKLVTLWDSVRKSPHKTSTKGKGNCGERCACPHGWFSPAQVSLFFVTFFLCCRKVVF